LLALNGLHWPVAVSATHMQVGCQNHSHGAWRKFNDAHIASMDDDALSFWQANKKHLLTLCEMRASMPE
jgi:hypothetical protein